MRAATSSERCSLCRGTGVLTEEPETPAVVPAETRRGVRARKPQEEAAAKRRARKQRRALEQAQWEKRMDLAKPEAVAHQHQAEIAQRSADLAAILKALVPIGSTSDLGKAASLKEVLEKVCHFRGKITLRPSHILWHFDVETFNRSRVSGNPYADLTDSDQPEWVSFEETGRDYVAVFRTGPEEYVIVTKFVECVHGSEANDPWENLR